MHCTSCGKNIPSDSRFCQFCGKTLSINQPIKETETVKESTLNSSHPTCEVCGACAPVKYNEFYANIGMLVTRRQMHIKAKMCKACTDKYFWNYTFTNLFLGWWGAISFFATFFFILNNTYRYITTINLKKYY